MKIHDSATIICTKAFIIYLTVTVLALHLMNNYTYPRCHYFHVRHHHHYHPPDSCVQQCCLWHTEQPCLFPNIISGYFQHVSSILVSGPLLQLTPIHLQLVVIFGGAYLLWCSHARVSNLGSCELYRFRSHIWRQSNCMTMTGQYAINSVDISLGLCGRINY